LTTHTALLTLRKYALSTGLIAGLAFAPAAFAQKTPDFQEAPTFLTASVELPDAPGMKLEKSETPAFSSSLALGESPQSTATYSTGPTAHKPGTAAHLDKYIDPGQEVLHLSPGDKIALGFKDAFSPFSFAGWALAAGYEQALNGSPNYGTNATAFGKRFGASAARAASEGVFSDSVMASVLREDPRYYRMGPGHNIFRRAGYAVTRTMITRTDSGRTVPNFALLGGNLGGAYLTKAYYPDLNTSNTEVLKTFGGSIGGSALGFAVSEFFGSALNMITFGHHHD
jgi:hypothetical protein